ncbi:MULTISPECIES: bifunctional 3-(3-hydroxy-phenyl)propionate/3-hydroxycinnamic acid hydroxylase [Amycolatopsis]|uniref:bifunctional 3-(3-hydroxy-phenyl)propionate/3-hydroxycinnamic acid hydroxylase MhpA n=1 Tax=Amycolatopsis TaxID=1813 RepID=UPI000B8A7B4E|nr:MULTISPECIES: bifunctional 3-(3-hydroxy-phenyl)propionate/3-hydroxycinnamic acid hydroxylase [Amycolatopsis]OXM63581.1 3-(3-hydroxyphenyl)propionate hydroxylase [Amycolatopsis sp. KNN50.9b]
MDFDVAVIGYGPVGKLLAIQLGRRGHRVVVLDRNEADYPLPRAVTHCSDFARILQSVGLPPSAIPDITEPYDDLYVWRNGDGETLVEVDWSGRGESGWYNTYFFSQPALEARLDSIIRGLPAVRVLRGWEATAVDAATGAVEACRGGERLAVSASWVVGADGANSRVRGWAGIGWHDEGYFHDWLVVDVKPRPGLEFPHIATQSCDVRRPSTMVPGGPGRRRWEFMRLPHESKQDLNRAEKAWELLAPHGITPGNAELERHSTYTFQAGWAQRWRAGRVLLAGDAAHLMPPFAGQGLGAGVRDVMNLGWKLDLVLRGLAGAELLDTYGSERLHHARAFVRFSVELGKVICIADPAEAAERDRRMIASRAAGGKPPAPPRPGLGPGLHTGESGGILALQGRVSAGGVTGLFDDVFGGPGALITREPCSPGGLAELGISVVALDEVTDVDGTYTRWLSELDAPAVLIRPDFHVFGAGDPAWLAGEFIAAVQGRRRPMPREIASAVARTTCS